MTVLTLKDRALVGKENQFLAVGVNAKGQRKLFPINKLDSDYKWTRQLIRIDERVSRGRTISEIVIFYNKVLQMKRDKVKK